MATLIKTGGEKVTVYPQDGKYFTLQELYKLIDCTLIDIISLDDGRLMVCDDEAKLIDDWEINLEATELFRAGRMTHREFREYMKTLTENENTFFIDASSDTMDCIAGDVLICEPYELEQ